MTDVRKAGPREAWEALRQHDPASVRDLQVALDATRLAFRLGDRSLVDAWITRALSLASAAGPTQTAEIHMAAASLDQIAGRFEGCRRHVDLALRLAPDAPTLRERAAGLLKAFGARDLAAGLLDDGAALDDSPGNPEAFVLRAQAKSSAGDARGAIVDLLAAKHVASEAQNWVIDLELVTLGRRHYGFLDIETLTALGRSPDNPSEVPSTRRALYRRFVAPALRHTARLAGRVMDTLPDITIERVARRLDDSFLEKEGEVAAPRDVRLRLLTRFFPEEMLARLGDDRLRTLSFVDPASGTLAPLPLRPSARQRAKVLQWSIRAAPPADVLGAFDAILRDHPRSHHPHAYRGELLLWLGRIDEAEEDFRRGLAIQPRARWLFIGMGAVHMLRGDHAAALASFQRSIDCAPVLVGPTLYGYRGEALRLRGDPRAAMEDLSRTCRDTPSRVSAWVNAWLALDDLGHVEARDAAWKELSQRAPWLLSDAAEETLGLVLPVLQERSARRAVLEYALGMSRGNRSSSCVTYITRDGELRTVFDKNPGADTP